jgi:hypothetical protein
MTNRFLMSVAAAALIAGTGFANAQGTGTSRDPSAGSTVQQNAPSDSAKPSSGMKASQSDEKAAQPGGTKNQRAQDDMKAGAKGEKSAQDSNMKGDKSAQDNNLKGEKSKSMSSEMNDKSKAGKDMKAEGREDRNGMKAEGREGRNGNMNAEQKGAADSKSQTTTQSQTGQPSQSQTTIGQAGAGAKLSTEQRTKITSVIREQRVQPATNVNFSIAVGTRVPRTVSFHPLPREVVTIYPEWRGYEFFLVNNQIVVVNPRTLEIVDVIEV